MTKIETRSWQSDLEIRANEGGNSISGYAIVFDTLSTNLGGFVERVSAHALDGVDLSHVMCLANHHIPDILARADSGTLQMKVDSRGLFFEATFPDTTIAKDTLENIRVGNIKGCSFGFTVEKDVWEINQTGLDVRTIDKIGRLVEITLTPIPAYPDTTVAKRSLTQYRDNKNQRMKLLNYYELEERTNGQIVQRNSRKA